MVAEAPARNAKFCEACGAAAVAACDHCGQKVRGFYFVPGVVSATPYKPPSHCTGCGKPFPWTEERVHAIVDLIEMTEAPASEQAALRDSIPALVAETPSTAVAVARFRKFFGGAGKQVADGIKSVVVEITTEAIRRQLFGPGA